MYNPPKWGEADHPDWFHPVQLGDFYKDRRYEIFRRLGNGSYSTVWLAFDHQQEQFVAIKFKDAHSSKSTTAGELAFNEIPHELKTDHVVPLYDSFELDGPNGHHVCLVFQPMGPHLTEYIRRSSHLKYDGFRGVRLPLDLARRVMREVLVGLQELHQHGIVHGDLHRGNILVNIDHGLLASSERESLRQSQGSGAGIFSQPLGSKRVLSIPDYPVVISPLHRFVSMDLVPFVKLTDLGSAFQKDSPPSKLSTPARLRSPEYILGLPFGVGVDVWSFGCLVYQILTGSPLFAVKSLEGNSSDEETNDDHLIQISEVLSPLPDNLSQHWRRGHKYFDPSGGRLQVENESCVPDCFSCKPVSKPEALPGNEEPQGGCIDYGARLANVPITETLEEQFRRHVIYPMCDSQQEEVTSLIRWILQVDASQRPSVEEILAQPWLQG